MTLEDAIVSVKTWEGCMRKANKTNSFALEFIDGAVELTNTFEKHKWIPVTTRLLTPEERLELGWSEDITHTFTCELPDDGDEILISRNNGKWVTATVFCNDDYGVGDEAGHDWLYEVDAWMPMPKGYIKK